MKSTQKDINQVEAYLKGSLSEKEMLQTQKRILEDPAFAELVTNIKLIRDSIILAKKKSLLAELRKLEGL